MTTKILRDSDKDMILALAKKLCDDDDSTDEKFGSDEQFEVMEERLELACGYLHSCWGAEVHGEEDYE